MPGSERLIEIAISGSDISTCDTHVTEQQETTCAAHTQAIGVDIVDIQRMQTLYERWGVCFLSRLFTLREQSACRKATGYRWCSLAGRFAAKEAVKKILAGRGEIANWIAIEVLNGPYGEPYIRLHEQAMSALERAGYAYLVLSISHDANLAIATVMAYR
ncbi:MAG TPA: holo-ACP synthase [Ktedonobacteraceae bacterium]|jgi:holo-[acyl-carrier protein] synthase|nr:holo-ACP synthase [Ktedonobacteraceae bacterium]